ncbi:hypothetical protein AB0C33_01885 [Nonomuraea sp. NPDC048881]|uniref:hypothetical protein n=1 Tax=Nonomuraea sp. NPDC048881 TaxID=3155030 RepID=UPI0033D06DFC
MTDQDWDLDSQEDSQPAGPRALRDAYERQKQEAADLRKQLASLNDKVRRQEVSELLTSKGIPKDAIDLFPKDVEVSEESVGQWVERYGGLFTPAQKQEAKEEDAPTDMKDQAPKVDEQQFKQMQQVSTGGAPGIPQQDLEAMLTNPHLEKEVPFEVFREALEKGWANLK